MKTILLNPPMNLELSLGKAKAIAKYTAMVPLGLAYIAATLQKNRKDIELIDAYAENLTIVQIVDRILRQNPDIVGISCVTPSAPITFRISRALKEKNATVKIIVGGPHPTILPQLTIEEPSVDIVVRGEGEATLLEIVNAFELGKDLERINGISYKKNGETVHTQDRAFLNDIDSLPYPAYEMLPLDRYKAPPHWAIREPVFFIFATRGCPFRCAFCAAELTGKTRRLRSVQNVIEEVEFLIEHYKIQQIMFQDTCFPFKKQHAINLCNGIVTRGLHKKMVWTTSTRVDLVDQELLSIMYESGCRVINYGIESGNQNVLNRIRKGFTLEQVRKATKMTHKAKIKNFATFMLGLPGDTYETCLQTIQLAKELELDFAQFYMTVPYPGTAIYDEAIKDGTLKSKNWEEYITMVSMTSSEPTYIPEGMTAQQLKELQKKAYREFYFRIPLAIHHLNNIKSLSDLKRYIDTAKVLLQTL